MDILFSMQDKEYKEFIQKLIPTVNAETIIGVRTADIRKLAKKMDDKESFLRELPHKFYEENNLHAFIVAAIKDYKKCVEQINIFLPFVDNWATCDGLRPKCFAKNRDLLINDIEKWIKSKHTYTVRFGIEMLMLHFLDSDFNEDIFEKVSAIKSDEYYVKMMIAWFFATALTKQWEQAYSFLQENRLEKWTHNKAVQKGIESNCLTKEQKQVLRELRKK